MTGAILFDRDQVERLDDLDDRPRRLSGTKLLWVDLDNDSEDEADAVAQAFDIDEKTRRYLAAPNDREQVQALGIV